MIPNIDALGQLLGAYLHQDWMDEFESDEAALQAIVMGEPVVQLQAGVREIDALLKASLSEAELARVLMDEAGCYLNPGYLGLTYEAWLKRVRDAFAHASR